MQRRLDSSPHSDAGGSSQEAVSSLQSRRACGVRWSSLHVLGDFHPGICFAARRLSAAVPELCLADRRGQ